ncbi:MAG: divergent polysaccharide deacetylase family protein [Nitrospirae bacterium]|nr:divergent polysaccharide deacetylase family protein [Nitrospirota bacterium]
MARNSRRSYKRRVKRRKLSPLATVALVMLTLALAVVAFLAGRKYVGHNQAEEHHEQEYIEKTFPPELDILPPAGRKTKPPHAHGRPGEVAIVIDDLGMNTASARRLMTLSGNLTFAVIPWLPHSHEIVTAGVANGVEVILHQPMEAHDYRGRKMRGMLLTGMTDDQLRETLNESLNAYPGIKGLNNHMGSTFTENFHAMKTVTEELGRKGLYFLDSVTSASSAGRRAAATSGIKAYRRDVFLDNKPDYLYMLGMWERFIAMAREHGDAILIAHDRRDTISFLERRLGDLEKQELTLVSLSRLPSETPVALGKLEAGSSSLAE